MLYYSVGLNGRMSAVETGPPLESQGNGKKVKVIQESETVTHGNSG